MARNQTFEEQIKREVKQKAEGVRRERGPEGGRRGIHEELVWKSGTFPKKSKSPGPRFLVFPDHLPLSALAHVFLWFWMLLDFLIQVYFLKS